MTRWTAVVFASATGLIGAVLGALPSIVGRDPEARSFWPMTVTGVLAVMSAFTLWAGARMWRHRQDVMTRRGTAYVIDEIAGVWTHEEKASFVDALSSHFASVLHVPGPADLGGSWTWSLDDGAQRWSDELTTLVRSFWAVHFNDDQVTHNAVFVWAWWSVALGFGARATAGRRGLTLRVRQRPSWGREGWIDADGWTNDPHVFVRDRARTFPDQATAARPVELAIHRCPPAQASSAIEVVPPTAGAGSPDPAVTVLLVRMTATTFGQGLEQDSPAGMRLAYTVDDYAGIGVAGTVSGQLFEWQDVAAPDHHSWDRYPELAQAAFEWIGAQAAAAPGPVLLAMLVPQEVAVGIGVLAAAASKDEWPASIWPLHYRVREDRLVVPGSTSAVPGCVSRPFRDMGDRVTAIS